MKKPTLKIVFIAIFALYVIVKCGGSIYKKTDTNITLNSRISTNEVARESIINSINPVFIFNSYVEAINIYRDRRDYANKILEDIEITSDEETSKSERSEIKNDIIFSNSYNGEKVINRHLSATAKISLFTPFIFIFCAVAIIITVNGFKWKQLGYTYFDKYLK